ncbi:MAG: hypothetical protein ASARMPREDX12_008842 [Alectoria sarmentosa]|nr:MAG: hypothetical protein ASARMPREDX12_008842 [Alectoria sarmentosa]
MPTKTVRTRLLILSDTHTASPFPPSDPTHAYRLPLPEADILLHAGDITKVGYLSEYEKMLDMLRQAPAELKLVIPGNHDITLHEEFYVGGTGKEKHVRRGGGGMEDVKKIRKMWTGEEARKAGIVYLEEGVRTFELKNGASFTVYSSPWQPQFYDWAFTYPRQVDRFNPSPAVVKVKAANPVPDHPAIDIMLSHGPPKGILDETDRGEKVFEDRCASVDISESGGKPLKWGQETLFVNASIMDVNYNPTNAPWVVDIDLPTKQGTS